MTSSLTALTTSQGSKSERACANRVSLEGMVRTTTGITLRLYDTFTLKFTQTPGLRIFLSAATKASASHMDYTVYSDTASLGFDGLLSCGVHLRVKVGTRRNRASFIGIYLRTRFRRRPRVMESSLLSLNPFGRLKLTMPSIQGLSPVMYWHHQARLLSASRSALPDLVSSIVTASPREKIAGETSLVPVSRVKSRLAVGATNSMLSDLSMDKRAFVIITSRPLSLSSSRHVLLLEAPAGKKGQYCLLTHILPQALDFLKHHLRLGEDVAILCEDGKDVSVGVAVAALTLFFEENGACAADSGSLRTRESVILGNTTRILNRRPSQLLNNRCGNACNGSFRITPERIHLGQP